MAEKVLMKGNEALAEAAIQAGCHHFFGYPITPQTELAAYMAKRMPKIGGTYLQAESEIAAVNMVLGAAAAGVRAMTSSSSPGISLKGEGISYMAGSDLPGLIINVQRGAFDKADEYRMPAMILADGMLGQMMEPVELPEHKDRKLPEKPWAACGHENKREHNIINSLYLTPNALEDLVRARYERYKIVEEKEQRAEEYRTEDADVIVVAYGASSRVARSAVNKAREAGKKVGLIRPITLWPFPKDAIKRAADHTKELLVVEMSMGQMVDDVRLAAECRVPVHFYGRTGGVIPTPKEILGEIDKLLK